MCRWFSLERNQIPLYPLKVTSPIVDGFDLILDTWPILLITDFYVEQTIQVHCRFDFFSHIFLIIVMSLIHSTASPVILKSHFVFY